METKKQIRKRALALREALSPEERKRAEILMTDRILGHQLFYSAKFLLGFASYGSEIATTEILKEALRLGKEVYLPRVEGEQMIFYRTFSIDELILGYKGIPEPVGNTERFGYTEELAKQTVMLMPGVAFDRKRNRIGYGKGFYDRYLAGKEELQLRTIAIGFQCQMFEEIPAEETDIRPGQVICL